MGGLHQSVQSQVIQMFEIASVWKTTAVDAWSDCTKIRDEARGWGGGTAVFHAGGTSEMHSWWRFPCWDILIDIEVV